MAQTSQKSPGSIGISTGWTNGGNLIGSSGDARWDFVDGSPSSRCRPVSLGHTIPAGSRVTRAAIRLTVRGGTSSGFYLNWTDNADPDATQSGASTYTQKGIILEPYGSGINYDDAYSVASSTGGKYLGVGAVIISGSPSYLEAHGLLTYFDYYRPPAIASKNGVTKAQLRGVSDAVGTPTINGIDIFRAIDDSGGTTKMSGVTL